MPSVPEITIVYQDLPHPSILHRFLYVYGVPLPDNLSKFVDKIPIELSFVLDKISEHGGVWIVGGAVRDAAIGVFPDDIDLATDLLPEKILNIFPNSIETGVAFGTVTVKSGKYLFQITTLRTDGKYLDNRRPESVIWNNSLWFLFEL